MGQRHPIRDALPLLYTACMALSQQPVAPFSNRLTDSIAIYYEHPQWFERLFAELDRRGAPYRKLKADQHFFDPSARDNEAALIFNRMSPSAWRRGHGQSIWYTTNYLADLELRGRRVVNGAKAFRYEVSKALQLSLLQSLNLAYPKARVIQDPAEAFAASEGLRFPVVIKPNVGGSGAGVVRFDTPEALRAAAEAGTFDLGPDQVGLVQEFIPARDGHITRVEVVGRKFLYAIKVYLSGQTFDLCPADICRTSDGQSLDTACPVEAPKAGLRVEGYRPPDDVIANVERIMEAADIEVGGVEYIVDDRDGTLYYYDINALSNFVADAPRVIGFDPFVNLADYLIEEASRVR
jgi:hypothetical protein